MVQIVADQHGSSSSTGFPPTFLKHSKAQCETTPGVFRECKCTQCCLGTNLDTTKLKDILSVGLEEATVTWLMLHCYDMLFTTYRGCLRPKCSLI